MCARLGNPSKQGSSIGIGASRDYDREVPALDDPIRVEFNFWMSLAPEIDLFDFPLWMFDGSADEASSNVELLGL